MRFALFYFTAFLILHGAPMAATSAHAESAAAGRRSPLRVGMLLPLSGAYGVIGADTRQGVEIALAELGEDRLSAVFGDSRTEPAQAISEFRRMVGSEQARAVFAFRGPVGMAVNPLSAQSKIALLGGVGNADFAKQNSYAFQIWPPSDREGGFIAGQVIARGAKRIALVTAQDDWTDAVSEGFRKELSGSGVELVFDEDVTPSESDLRSLVLKLKAAGPDAVFINLVLRQLGPAIRQLHEQGVEAALYSNFWLTKPEVFQSVGQDAVEGLMYAELNTDLPNLSNELKKRFNATPSAANLSAYVATMMLGQAARGLKEDAGNAEVYQALLAIDRVDTKNGSFPVKARVVQFPLELKVIRGGKPVIVGSPNSE